MYTADALKLGWETPQLSRQAKREPAWLCSRPLHTSMEVAGHKNWSDCVAASRSFQPSHVLETAGTCIAIVAQLIGRGNLGTPLDAAAVHAGAMGGDSRSTNLVLRGGQLLDCTNSLRDDWTRLPAKMTRGAKISKT